MVKKLYFVSIPLKRKAESSQIDLFVDIFSMADFQDHHNRFDALRREGDGIKNAMVAG